MGTNGADRSWAVLAIGGITRTLAMLEALLRPGTEVESRVMLRWISRL
jgi:hypothetical protein